MKAAIRLALALYPRWWRRRYGREMDALLEDAGSGWAAVFDIARGAAVVRLRDFGGSMRRVSMLLVLIPTLIGALTMFIVAMRTPPRYRAEALIEVVTPTVEPDKAPGSLDNRLESIAARVLTRARLETIIKDLDLYPRERARSISILQITDAMREDIGLVVGNPGDSRGVGAWFEVSFVSSDPKVAKRVTDRLAAMFLDESTRDRKQPVELARLEKRLAEIETVFTAARQRHERSAELVALNREYGTVEAEYRTILANVEKANAERREHFSLRNFPTLPTTPIGPNRLLMTAWGAGVGLAIGLLLLAGRIIGRGAGGRMQTASAG